MKNFLTSMLGALAALLVFALGGFLLLAGILGAIVSLGVRRAGTAPAAVENGSYLVFNLSANITDAPPRFDLSSLGSSQKQTLQLRQVVRALRTAARDPAIAGILLDGSLAPAGYGTGYAALREVREALEAFRRSGKPIKAYLKFATTRDYYLASAANQITLDPYGVIYMPGLSVERAYYAGALQKFGIGIQVTRVGKYKSYVEPFIRQDMSPADRRQTQELLGDIWNRLLGEIARARGLTPGRIQATVDADGLISAAEAKQAGLADQVADRGQLIAELKAKAGPAAGRNAFRQVALTNYIRARPDLVSPYPGRGRDIAVVYAEGEIVDGRGQFGEVGGRAFAGELRKLRQDGNVKAIVLRVNIPGGSVTASEDIQRELRLARKVKPVIVSMGSYAASGGYWISAYGNRIFAEPTTITGSIGVFGIQFDVQKLMAGLGITFDRVKTGRFADALTITRPKTPAEMAILQSRVDWIYGQFIDKVAQARKLPRARVEEIAQGRVWSGTQAMRLGLVDQIGGLDAAIGYAASRAGLGKRYRLIEYPGRKNLAQQVAELLGKTVPDDLRGEEGGLAGKVEQRLKSELAPLRAFNDPDGLYARLPLDLSIR